MKDDPTEPCICTPDQSFFETATLEDAMTHIWSGCYTCTVYNGMNKHQGIAKLIERFGLEEVKKASDAKRAELEKPKVAA